MRKIVVGDLHITENSISELTDIFNDYIFYIEADEFIQLGDWFDKNTPTPLELKFSSELVVQLKKKYPKVTILSGTGSHDLKNDCSVIEHLSALGVNTVVGDYIDEWNILYGHWMTNESKLEYGTGKCSVKDLENKYKYVFLGHQHQFEALNKSKTIYHLGSLRRVNFNEVGYLNIVAILDNGVLTKLDVAKPAILMEETDNFETLKSKDSKKFIRYVFHSFEQYLKEAEIVNRELKRFYRSTIKMDFEKPKNDVIVFKPIIEKKDIIKRYIENIANEEVKNILKEQFKCISNV